MSQLYVLHAGAEADLREIARYTRKQWGQTQARIYRDKLIQCIEGLASGSGIYKPFSTGRHELRVARCQHHYVFVQQRQNALALVVAVLHERMDLIERLKARLTV